MKNNDQKKTARRIVGGILVGAGIICIILFFGNAYFGVLNGSPFKTTSLFPLFFVGFVLVAVGNILFSGRFFRGHDHFSEGSHIVPKDVSGSVLCGACGTENDPDAKYCKSCGASLSLRCPACGQPTEPGAKFCENCGKKL